MAAITGAYSQLLGIGLTDSSTIATATSGYCNSTSNIVTTAYYPGQMFMNNDQANWSYDMQNQQYQYQYEQARQQLQHYEFKAPDNYIGGLKFNPGKPKVAASPNLRWLDSELGRVRFKLSEN